MTSAIEKTCQYLISRALPTSSKYCAKAIRMAVDFGFSTHVEHTGAAKNYGPIYEKLGFKKVFSYPTMDKKDYSPQIGDICIIQYEPNGHICMNTVQGWISDFKQRDMYGGKVRDKDPHFDIYRYS